MEFDITLAKYRTMTIDARDKKDALRRADFLKNPGEKVVSGQSRRQAGKQKNKKGER